MLPLYTSVEGGDENKCQTIECDSREGGRVHSTKRMIQCPDEVEYFLETNFAAWARHWQDIGSTQGRVPLIAASYFSDLLIGGLTPKGNQTPDFCQQFILLIKILSLLMPLTPLLNHSILGTVYFTHVLI